VGGTMKSQALACCLIIGIAGTAVGQDDRSNTQPTQAFWYSSTSQAPSDQRFTDINVESVNPPVFSALAVPNSGAYGKGWWWWYGQDEASLRAKTAEENSRIVDLDVYTVGGQRQIVALLISNTGQDAKTWWWVHDQPIATVVAQANQLGARLTALKCYAAGSTRLCSSVMVANTGADQRAWWWGYELTADGVANLINQNPARLIYIQVSDTGHFNVLAEGSKGESWWWYYGKTQDELSALATQNGARLIDVAPYDSGGRRVYAGIMLKPVPVLQVSPASFQFSYREYPPLTPPSFPDLPYITVDSDQPTSFSATVPNQPSWLIVSPLSNQTPTKVFVQVKWPLAAGNYSASIVLTPLGGTPAVVSVQYTVLPSCVYQLQPSTTQFDYSGGSGTVSITTTGDCGWGVTANASWLTYSPIVGFGNGTVNFTVAPHFGQAQSGVLQIGNASVSIQQTASPAPALASDPIVSLATLASGPAVSPGSLIRIRGVSLAAPATSSQVPLPWSLNDVSVAIGGRRSSILAVAFDHVDAQVPWGLSSDTPLVEITSSRYDLTTTAPWLPAAPAVLSANDSGVSRPAIYRTTAGSLASTLVTPQNPIQPGDQILVRVTGIGPVSDPPADGALGFQDSKPLYPIRVALGGVEANIDDVSLYASGSTADVGVSALRFTAPAEIPFGDGIPLVVRVEASEAPAAPVSAAGTPLTVNLQLAQPDVTSANPLTALALKVSGLHPAAPAGVRFFTSDGAYSETVRAFSITADGFQAPVSPYYDGSRNYADGDVSIEVLQLINGRLARSNAVSGFRILKLPETGLPAGTVAVAMLRSQAESQRALEGDLDYLERAGKRRGAAGARATLEAAAVAASKTADGLAGIVADPTVSLPIADFGQGLVSFDSTTLARVDRLLAAVILAGYPPLPTPEASQPAALFRTLPRSDAAAQTVLPDCEIPAPPARELIDLARGRSPAASYVDEYRACLATLAQLQSIDDFSAELRRRMDAINQKLNILASWAFPSLVAAADGTHSPAGDAEYIGTAITEVFSVPTYASVVGQSLAGIAALVVAGRTDSAAANAVLDDVYHNLRESFQDWGVNQFYDTVGKVVGSSAFGPGAGAGAVLLGGNIQADLETIKSTEEADGRTVEPEDAVSASGSNAQEAAQMPPAKTIDGSAKNGAGAPASGGSIQLCPPLPGSSGPPLSESPTYGDGSYEVIIPINFDEPDKVCKVILSTPGQADQEAAVDVTQPPAKINFPEDFEGNQVTLAGSAPASGNVPGCGVIAGEGLFDIRLSLPTNLGKLASDGGTVTGSMNDTKRTANVSTCKPVYSDSPEQGVPVVVQAGSGGSGTLTYGNVTFTIQVSPWGISGQANVPPDVCGANATSCQYTLGLTVFK
jgi:uncharacterized protein (TIGR03437 family)